MNLGKRRSITKNVVYYIEKNCLGMMGFPYIHTYPFTISKIKIVFVGEKEEGELMMKIRGKSILSIFYDFDP